MKTSAGLIHPDQQSAHDFFLVIGEDIAYVQYKWPIGKPRIDHLRGPIWEVRSKVDNRIASVLFAVEGSETILLHACI